MQVVAIKSGSNWQMFAPWRRTPRPCVLRRSRGFMTMPLGSGYNVRGEKYSILSCLAAISGLLAWMLRALWAPDPTLKVRGADSTQKVITCKCLIDGVSFLWSVAFKSSLSRKTHLKDGNLFAIIFAVNTIYNTLDLKNTHPWLILPSVVKDWHFPSYMIKQTFLNYLKCMMSHFGSGQ